MSDNENEGFRQVSTRVSVEVWRVLQLALAAEKAKDMQGLLRPVVESYAGELLRAPEMQEARRALRELQAREAGELERIDKKAMRDKPSA